jgi:anaerobic selenocysteine-containing dehydrogenase
MCREAGATRPPSPAPARRAPPVRQRGGRPARDADAGPALGFPRGPEDLLIDGDGAALRIDKAFSWDAPLAIHGMLQTVITNAWRGDPYPVDVLFLYMANMAWNSAMNTAETMAMLTDKDPATGEYKIPRFIYADAFDGETVAFADLVLPDTTYLERWDCISLLDRPVGGPHGPGDSIRQPVLAPDRDVRPFQDVLIELGARLGLPAFAKPDGSPRYPGGYPDYMVNHERKPGVGPLAGWRGAAGDEHGRGAPNPDQLAAYVANGCFWRHELEPEEEYYKPVNRAYLEKAHELGLREGTDPVTLHLYCEPLQRFRLAAEGHGPVQPPDTHRERIRTYFDPLPFWYVPFEERAFEDGGFPLHAVTQRPMPMYHSWGSQNAWLRQIMARNHLYMNRGTAGELGLGDGDWVWVTSPHGRVKAQLKLMEGCAPHTVWTWNAIGKRAGAWGLAATAPESQKGFLLNHVIAELLPEDKGYSRRTLTR